MKKYEYDTLHNYIKETCLSGGDVIYAQKRVISYINKIMGGTKKGKHKKAPKAL